MENLIGVVGVVVVDAIKKINFYSMKRRFLGYNSYHKYNGKQ